MRTDPLAFEALRHRIATIADEGSAVLSMVSSSPVASEANDCNVAIMDAHGSAIAIGPGLASHGIACMMTARYVRTEYAENPGIRQGDMFLTNDPYRCTPHQTCFALVTPVFFHGDLVAWVGAGIHVPDAGGPVAGQVAVGAQSVYQEATPMLPLRIVEGGIVRKDLEHEYVIRSRTPQQLALDLRAMIAACDRLTARIDELVSVHGAELIGETFEDMIAYSQAHLTDRIRKVSDGAWHGTAWLDYPEGGTNEFYACELTIRKEGDSLTFDFTKSSPQAPAVINSGEPGLVSSILNALMAMLGYGLPLCPEAVLRAVSIESKPGTFVHATHPAGCSKATTAACMSVRQAINVTLSQMFADTAELEQRVLAGSGGYLPVIDVSGLDQRGDRFGVPLLDIALSAGYGAMPDKDGIDSAGTMGAPASSIANVEVYEARYPILYLWRRHALDSGGLGRFRGGCGLELAFTPHLAPEPLEAVLHGHGVSVPSTPGLHGGSAGATNTFVLHRDTNVLEVALFSGLPQDADTLGGTAEPTPGLYRTRLAPGDVVVARNNGGGGLGDPLTREPSSVLSDVRRGIVSAGWAEKGYGVVLASGDVDVTATHLLRDDLRRQRLQDPDRVVGISGLNPRASIPSVCANCRSEVGETTVLGLARDVRTLGRYVLPHHEEGEFRAVEAACPTCGTVLDVEVRRQAG